MPLATTCTVGMLDVSSLPFVFLFLNQCRTASRQSTRYGAIACVHVSDLRLWGKQFACRLEFYLIIFEANYPNRRDIPVLQGYLQNRKEQWIADNLGDVRDYSQGCVHTVWLIQGPAAHTLPPQSRNFKISRHSNLKWKEKPNYVQHWHVSIAVTPSFSSTKRHRHWLIYWASWIWYSHSSFYWRLLWNWSHSDVRLVEPRDIAHCVCVSFIYCLVGLFSVWFRFICHYCGFRWSFRHRANKQL